MSAQSVREGVAQCREFQAVMRGLLADVRSQGPRAEDDNSVAAHLLRIKVHFLSVPGMTSWHGVQIRASTSVLESSPWHPASLLVWHAQPPPFGELEVHVRLKRLGFGTNDMCQCRG